jgi:WD40 repeat protein
MAEICRQLMEAYGKVVGRPYARTHIVEALAGDEPAPWLGAGADISNRALSLHDLGRTEEALELLQHHLAGNPYDPLPWCSQAALQIRLKRTGVAEVARRFTETILPLRPRWADLGIDPSRLLGYMGSHFAAGHTQAILDLDWLESPKELVSAAVDGTIVRWAAGSGGWVVQQRIGAVSEEMSATLICPRSDRIFLGFENGKIEQRALSSGDVLGVLDVGAAAKDRGQVVPQSGKPVSRAIAGIVRLHGSDDLRVYLRSPDDFLVSLSDWKILDAQHLPRTLTIKAAAPDDGRFVVLAEEWGLVHISRDGWIKELHYFQIRHEVEGATAGSRVTNRIELAAVAVSRDGKWIAAGTRRGSVLMFKPDEALSLPYYHGDDSASFEWRSASEDPIRALSFGPEGDMLFFCDGLNVLWKGNLETKVVTELARFDPNVSAVAVSPDGSTIAVGTEKGTILFEPITNTSRPEVPLLVSKPTPSDEYIRRRRETRNLLAKAEDALQSGSYQQCLNFVAEGIALSQLQGSGEASFRDLLLRVPGNRSAISGVKLVWNKSFRRAAAAHTSALLHAAAISMGAPMMLLGSDEGLHKVRLLDGGVVDSIPCPQVTGIAYHPTLAAFVASTGCPHSSLAQLSSSGGLYLFRSPIAPESLNAIAAIRDQTVGGAVVVADHGRFLLWRGGNDFDTSTLGSEPFLTVAVSPDDGWAAVGDLTGRVLCVDLSTGRRLSELAGHKGGVRHLDMSPAGELLASVGDDSAAFIWTVVTRTLRTSLDHEGNPVRAVKFSPMGDWVVTGDSVGTIRFWTAETGLLEHRLQTPYGEIASLCFDQSGGLLATAHLSGTVCVWQITWTIDASATGVEAWSVRRDCCETAKRRAARPFR